jgi:hypothetical protein
MPGCAWINTEGLRRPGRTNRALDYIQLAPEVKAPSVPETISLSLLDTLWFVIADRAQRNVIPTTLRCKGPSKRAGQLSLPAVTFLPRPRFIRPPTFRASTCMLRTSSINLRLASGL